LGGDGVAVRLVEDPEEGRKDVLHVGELRLGKDLVGFRLELVLLDEELVGFRLELDLLDEGRVGFRLELDLLENVRGVVLILVVNFVIELVVVCEVFDGTEIVEETRL
jgi:hypothetical protein